MSACASFIIPVSNYPDTCDSLHIINLASDVVSIAAVHANTQYFIQGLAT